MAVRVASGEAVADLANPYRSNGLDRWSGSSGHLLVDQYSPCGGASVTKTIILALCRLQLSPVSA